jgi:hypothetical protein
MSSKYGADLKASTTPRSRKRPEVPSVTLARTCLMKSSADAVVGNVSTQRPHRRTKGHTEERYEEDTSIPAGRRISAKFPAFFGTFWGATARRPTGASNRVVLQGNDQTNTLNVFSLMVSHRF